MSYSFYGGQQGKNFEIKQIFRTFGYVNEEAWFKDTLGATEVSPVAYYRDLSLQNDLEKRWNSSIGVGELVMVSYGLPNVRDEDYDKYRKIDLKACDNKTYNGTLWQKVYVEESEAEEWANTVSGIDTIFLGSTLNKSGYGIGYVLIASLTGYTPLWEVLEREWLHANELPFVTYDLNDLDNPKIQFHLPRSQVATTTTKTVTMGSNVSVENIQVTTDSKDIDEPVWQFSIPAQAVLNKVELENIPVAEKDSNGVWQASDNQVEYKLTGDYQQEMNFKFITPRNQNINQGKNTILHANEDPYFEIYKEEKSGVEESKGATVDNPLFCMYQPQPPKPEVSSETIAMGNEPTVANIAQKEDYSYWDNPEIHFSIPASPKLGMVTLKDKEAASKVNGAWKANGHEVDISLSGTYKNNVDIVIQAPKSQNINLAEKTILDANQEPQAELYKEYNSTKPKSQGATASDPILHFSLPQSQVLQSPDIEVLDSTANPSVTLDESDINKPKYTFHLPAAAHYFYGDQLGKKSAGTYTITTFSSEMKVGDYYVNEGTGFIYKLTAIDKSANTSTFVYQARLSAPVPSVAETTLSPYTGKNGSATNPTIASTYENTTEQTGWKLTFGIPKAPNFSINYAKTGAAETGSANTEILDANTVQLNLTIPAGSRIFSGTALTDSSYANVTVDGAQNGDCYLNSDTGSVFFRENGKWVKSNGTLKGPVGDSLKISDKSFTITSKEVSVSGGVDTALEEYLNNNISSYPLPNNDELCSITYTDSEDDTNYYWGYASNGKWKVSRLTGGVGNLLKDDYDSSGTTEKAYSVNYINTLIKDESIDSNKELVTYSANYIDSAISDVKENIETVENNVTNILIDSYSYTEDKAEKAYNAEYIDTLIKTETVADKASDEDIVTYSAKYINDIVSTIPTDILASTYQDTNNDTKKAYNTNYINGLVKTVRTTADTKNLVYGTSYINSLIKTAKVTTDDADVVTYSAKYIDNAIGTSITNTLLDSYDKDNSTDKAYTTHYINTLTKNSRQTGSDISRINYSADYINNLIKTSTVSTNVDYVTYSAKYIDGMISDCTDKIIELPSNILSDEYVDNNTQAYTTRYINNDLVKNDKQTQENNTHYDQVTYSAKYVNDLEDRVKALEDQLEWFNF